MGPHISSLRPKTSVSNKDHLTTLPLEILLNIITEVPLDTFLSLTHTSSHLRNVMKRNASRICNDAITSRFAPQLSFLNSVKKDGWLLPNKREFLSEENWHYSIHWVLFSDLLRVTEPGPQFWYALEKGVVNLASDGLLYIVLENLGKCVDTLSEEWKKDGKGMGVAKGLRLKEVLWYHGVPELYYKALNAE